MKEISKDLADEYNELDAMVVDLSEKEWLTETPFFGWTIKDEIHHLAFFDNTGNIAAKDRAMFQKEFENFLKQLKPGDSIFEAVNNIGRKKPLEEILPFWRTNRNELVQSLEAMDPKARLPWYGPDMSARSFATARLMETWAHGQDVADTLKLKRTPTNRLKNIAHIGVTTFGWSFINRNLEVPSTPVHVELISPSGKLWTWGPEETDSLVKGTAEDFCLVVAQRRNVADTKLQVEGNSAEKWIPIAQAFAGPPEDGPRPGQRAVVYS